MGDGGISPTGDGGISPTGDGGISPTWDGGISPSGDGGISPTGIEISRPQGWRYLAHRRWRYLAGRGGGISPAGVEGAEAPRLRHPIRMGGRYPHGVIRISAPHADIGTPCGYRHRVISYEMKSLGPVQEWLDVDRELEGRLHKSANMKTCSMINMIRARDGFSNEPLLYTYLL